MGIFDIFRTQDINEGVKEFNSLPKAALIDVRTPEEYREGHIPRSRNISLQEIEKICSAITDRTMPLFVYCHSGMRSRQAVSHIQQLGYTNVRNIGGIVSYKEKLDK